MKVAVLIDTFYPFIGGGQINAWKISKILVDSGVHIDIITRDCGEVNLPKIKNLSVCKLGRKSDPDDTISKAFFVLKSLIFTLRRDYDLVHAHSFLPGITARFLMVFKGIPAVFTVHGASINTRLNNFFSRWFERFILTKIRYSAQITVSRDFIQIKNINKKIIHISNGMDVDDFNKVKASKFKNPTLIFVGRLHPQKNLPNLLKAILIVKKDIPDTRLVIVGEGEQKKLLKDQAKDLGLGKSVVFEGEVIGRDLVKLYKSSHLFILPSIYEGQPLSLLEAWAAKLPVIVSKTGDCPYLVKNGVNGYLIEDQNDPEEIAKSIKMAFKNKNLSKLGGNGYNFIKNNFSWDKSSKLTLEVYRSALKSKN